MCHVVARGMRVQWIYALCALDTYTHTEAAASEQHQQYVNIFICCSDLCCELLCAHCRKTPNQQARDNNSITRKKSRVARTNTPSMRALFWRRVRSGTASSFFFRYPESGAHARPLIYNSPSAHVFFLCSVCYIFSLFSAGRFCACVRVRSVVKPDRTDAHVPKANARVRSWVDFANMRAHTHTHMVGATC